MYLNNEKLIMLLNIQYKLAKEREFSVEKKNSNNFRRRKNKKRNDSRGICPICRDKQGNFISSS